MVKLARAIGFLSAIALIVASGYLGWVVLTQFKSFLTQANPSVAAAVIGAMATALVGIGGVLMTQNYTQKRAIAEAHRQRKVELYEGFIKMASRMVAGNNESLNVVAPSEQELQEFMLAYKPNVILWASPEVINAQLAFEGKSKSGHENVLRAVDRLYLAFREDLGLSNKGLHSNQLIKMYLREPEELDRSPARN